MYGDNISFRDVEDWLRSLGLICFAQSFYDNGYEDLDICRQIGEEDLDVIGVKNLKDRNDILAGVIRLKQRAVYFELEPESDESTDEVVQRKLEPFLLLTRLKAELEDHDIQLTQPPYFYPDGSFGDLNSLAKRFCYSLETFEDDVLGALEQLRRRQLPADSYKDVAEMMQLQKDQEVKHNISLPASDDQPDDYLNVEVPYRRSTLSKHDKRITKSTTDLFSAGTKKKSQYSKKRKPVTKSHSVYDKQSRSFLGTLSILKRTTSGGTTGKIDKRTSSVPAKDITMGQDELVDLMTKVKLGEISQESVVDQVNQHYRKSMAIDFSPPSSPDYTKPTMTRKEKKKLEKESKKMRKKTILKRSNPGNSFFYTTDIEVDHKSDASQSVVEDHGEDLLGLGPSSGSDISADGVDLLRTSEERQAITKLTDSHIPALSCEGSKRSSTGSIGKGTNNVNFVDLQDHVSDEPCKSSGVSAISKPIVTARISNSNGVKKSDQKYNTANNGTQICSGVNKINSLTSSIANHSLFNAANSPPIPPPRQILNDKQENSTTLPQALKNSVEFKDLPSSEQSSMMGKDNKDFRGDVKTLKVESHPLHFVNLNEIKQISTEIKRRSANSNFQADLNTKTDLTEVTHEPETSKMNSTLQYDILSTDPCQNNPPTPPPRPGTKKNKDEREVHVTNAKSARPVVPPRKIRSASYTSVSIGENIVARKSIEKQKPTVPRRDFSNSLKPTRPCPQSTTLDAADASSSTRSTDSLAFSDKTSKEPPHSLLSPDTGAKRIEGRSRKDTPTSPVVCDPKSEGMGKIVIKRKSLKDLILRKLTIETVDLAMHPYSLQDGSWNVPFPLVSRYAVELKRQISDVVMTMDDLRLELLISHSRPSKPCQLVAVLEKQCWKPEFSSVREWLISIGLPMFVDDFLEMGLRSVKELLVLSKEDVFAAGVYEDRHIEQLFQKRTEIQ